MSALFLAFSFLPNSPWIFFRIVFLRCWLGGSRIRRRIRRRTLAHIRRKDEKAGNGNEKKSSDEITWIFVQELLLSRRLLHRIGRDWVAGGCWNLVTTAVQRLLFGQKYRWAPSTFQFCRRCQCSETVTSCVYYLPWQRWEEGEEEHSQTRNVSTVFTAADFGRNADSRQQIVSSVICVYIRRTRPHLKEKICLDRRKKFQKMVIMRLD